MRWRRRIGSDWIGSATVSAWSENREAGTRDERERERNREIETRIWSRAGGQELWQGKGRESCDTARRGAAFSFKGHKAQRQGAALGKNEAIKCKCTHIPCCDPWRVEATSRRPPPSAATDYPRPSQRPILEHPRSSFLPRPPLYPAAARASCLSYRFQRPCGSPRSAHRNEQNVQTVL